jgi:exosortase
MGILHIMDTVIRAPKSFVALFASVRRDAGGWTILAALALVLWIPNVLLLERAWRSDPSLSFGPLIPLIAAVLIWMRRDCLPPWDRAYRPGLATIIVCGLFYTGASWLDIVFVKLLALLGISAGVIMFLGGPKAIAAAAPAVGFLLFMIPWPTSLTERLSFPLQLASTAYAAQFAGMLGLPIVRHGVELAVTPRTGAPPVFAIIVASPCSGLTSLMVLLALGYLVASQTPVNGAWRMFLVAAVVPLALITNALRLTLVLLAGTYHSASVAQWVHDHEQPVLLTFCTIGLMGLRRLMLHYACPEPRRDDTSLDVGQASLPANDPIRPHVGPASLSANGPPRGAN